MGSSTITTITIMAEDKKKSIKGLIKNIFGKKKAKDKITDKQNVVENARDAPVKVETLLENFKKLEIENKRQSEKEEELKNFSFNRVEDDELENFTFKVVEEERRSERTDSHSSEDSGFSEKDTAEDDVIKEEANEEANEDGLKDETEKEEDIIESLENLKIEDGKKKKSQLVPVSRGPIRNRGDYAALSHPYGVDSADSFRQISQVNKHTFSGGQVIVQDLDNQTTKHDTSQELQSFADGLAMCGVQIGQAFDLDIIQEYLDEENCPNILDEFIKEQNVVEQIQPITTFDNQVEKENPIEELENSNHLNYEEIGNLDSLLGLQEDKLYTNIFPTPPSTDTAHSPHNEQFYNNFLTPPRSETVPSPMSDTTLYPTHSDYTLSPNSDCEKYQEIHPYFEEYPTVVEEDATEKKTRERQTSTSSMSMKNFKDLQKEIAASFSKKECCQINRKPCKQIFEEHLKKLKMEERRNLCLKVAQMDLKTAYGVMQHILLSLSRGCDTEDLQLALFALLGERILAQKPQLFAQDVGLSLLKASSLRCPHRPLLTRYVVHCVRLALKSDPTILADRDCVFKETDAQGDTLVTACARAGDEYADVLSELLRREHNDVPLFNVEHSNTEGYSALHVACREHSDASSHLHVVHVLLEHGGADIWKGDAKGSDTAAHMCVNSAHCSLRLVLLLFRSLDRKLWKKLAHSHNRSSVTPLDYARCAAKSTTRQNYPMEVLDFLKKCR